ncbi:VanZ family protein [Enterocloster clostridioformis]
MKKYLDIGLKILFVIYLGALVWIIVFKLQFSLSNIDKARSINFIPFKGSGIVNRKINISEIINNAIIFIPFGIYLQMLKRDWNFLKCFLTFFGVSFIFEVIQYVFAIGRSDITDIIENTLGGCIGILIYYICKWIFKEKIDKVFYILATIGTIFMIMLLTITFLSN